MREKILGIMIPLGHDKYVESDVIIAVEPLPPSRFFNTDQNGHKLRSRVLINHAEGEILASRTAETILKSMTKSKIECSKTMMEVLEDNRKQWWAGMDEKDIIVNCLSENSTTRTAIANSPFGKSKFYKLIKKYNIDVKLYLQSTDDPESNDDGLA